MSDVLIPGLLIAAEICDQFQSENTRISFDEIQRICATDAWKDIDNHEVAHIHGCKARAASEIAAFLRRMAVEKGGAK
ncbi:hypothetical protein [Acetobacter estunensis]|uniref:hypothetical protein n=1 Tax=Acetobacter estunensis TaxID=104097 RepID=UPI001C2D56D8|nr:hypothetical protein [Acetobacter estunensis]MBV1837174.1 hypothetical protein [Acetobacter estunensis]